MRVLLADDEPLTRLVVQRMLGRLGCEVETVSDGSEALAALEMKAFDLLLLDVNMGWIGGREVARKVRERAQAGGEQAPLLVAISGDSPEEGGPWDAWMQKPVCMSNLSQILARAGGVFTPGTDTGAGELPLLDRESLRRKTGGDPELLDRLVGILRRDRSVYAQRLEAALDAEDWEELRRTAHALKGLLANLEGKKARKAAEGLEKLPPAAPREQKQERLRDVLVSVEELLRELETFCPAGGRTL